ncbi:nibrin-like isoform X2 [Antedon mediterranea]|uniref:nibrin-like isoform X2 n=1 Tax=Antedon mediterranea TaxID=105859 RepID=UPI003AF40D07
MWILRSLRSDQSYSFLVGLECIVGRKGCPILITNDQSISRKHATFAVSHSKDNLKHPERLPAITLKDSSKYGTIVNKIKVNTNSSTDLKHGDEIEFGSLSTNSWRVEYQPLVCAGSSLSGANKTVLKANLLKLGGHYVTNWSKECTHLVMSEISVTVKVICALVSCCPIVTLEYLNKLIKAAESQTSLPNISQFLPDVVEANIRKDEVSFQANPLRKKVFKDKKFVFLTEKEYTTMKTAVSFGGGQCMLMDEPTKDVKVLTQSGTCVVCSSPDEDTQAGLPSHQQWAGKVYAILEQSDLRPIQNQEIGLAVLYCSTELHCNPAVSQSGLNLMYARASQTLDTQVVLAPETQTPQQSSKRIARTKAVGEVSIIDETRLEKSDNKKRNRQDQDHDFQSPNKMARFESQKTERNESMSSNLKAAKTKELLPKSNVTKKNSKQSNLNSFLQPSTTLIETSTDADTLSEAASEVDMEINKKEIPSSDDADENMFPEKEVVHKDSTEEKKGKRKSDLLKTCKDSRQASREAKEPDVTLEEPSTSKSKRTPKRKECGNTDDSTGLWKKKIKIEFEEDSETEKNKHQAGRPRTLSGGFISVQAQECFKISPDDAIKPELDDLPTNLVKTSETVLVYRRPNNHRIQNQDVMLLNVKNFKRFKKGSYPGQQSMPRIIGGDDLVTHYNEVPEDVKEMFRGQADEDKCEFSQIADELFKNVPVKTKRKKF